MIFRESKCIIIAIITRFPYQFTYKTVMPKYFITYHLYSSMFIMIYGY